MERSRLGFTAEQRGCECVMSEHPFHLLIKFNPIISIPHLMCSGGRWSLSAEPVWRISSTSAASLLSPTGSFASLSSIIIAILAKEANATVKNPSSWCYCEIKNVLSCELRDGAGTKAQNAQFLIRKVAVIGPQRLGGESWFLTFAWHFIRSVHHIWGLHPLQWSRAEWILTECMFVIMVEIFNSLQR